MKKKHILITASIALCIIASIFIFINRNISYTNTNRTSHDTYVSYGFLDADGNILSNGSQLDLQSNKNIEAIHHTLDLDQFIEEDREYLLIAFVDFKQVTFKVDGKSYSSYKFNTSKRDHVQFDLQLDLPGNSKELDYILIRKPYYMPKEKNVDSLLPLQTIFPIRFKIADFDSKIKYEKSVKIFTEGPYDNVYISDNENQFDLLYEVNENNNIFLTLGNDSDENIDYAVILLNNWNQVSFNDGDLIKFFDVKSQEKQSIEIKVPEVDENSYFQAIAFPMPYQVNVNNMMSTNAFGSSKCIIKNN
ncbi:MAG: hypothetical protein RR835_10840 [Peptostreptococcaceae bacterium]